MKLLGIGSEIVVGDEKVTVVAITKTEVKLSNGVAIDHKTIEEALK